MICGNRTIAMLALLSLLTPGMDSLAQSQGPAASRRTFTISGTIGLAGVTLKGSPADVQTDENGVYSVEVPHGWRGAVTPMKTGYRFEPPNRSYYSVNADYRDENYTPGHISVTISGNVGLPGVVMQGLPGNPLTDSQGGYRVQVAYGWSGQATPAREGYSFTPPAIVYERVLHDQENNYQARELVFEISGNVGLPGIVMKGLPGGELLTDEAGTYVASVKYGWSGTVTPVRLGYVFEPPSRSYVKTIENLAQQDYTPRAMMFVISGEAGAPGVVMQGLPGESVTDQKGNYRAQVEYGWSGIVVPYREGLSFTPPAREYTSVTDNQNNENFAAEPQMCAISNVVAVNGEPIQDVTVLAEPGGYSAVTDSQGRYRVMVPYGWSGRLNMDKPGFEIVSETRYTNVTSDIVDGRVVPSSLAWPPVPSRMQSAVPQTAGPGSVGDVLVIPTADPAPERIAETTEDMRIMLHILREKLSEPRMILGVLRDYGSFFGEDRAVEAFYLQGTAAVFVVQADFPYSFATQQRAEGEPQQEPADPVWERARQRLYSPTGARGLGVGGQAGQTQQMTFEQFKDELLRSLKHAANLRNLDPNELIILTIVARDEQENQSGSVVSGGAYSSGRWVMGGYGSSGGYVGGSTYSSSSARRGVGGRGRAGLGPTGVQAGSSTTVLTMQARKADVDAFAKGELTFEQFQQRVRTFSY